MSKSPIKSELGGDAAANMVKIYAIKMKVQN